MNKASQDLKKVGGVCYNWNEYGICMYILVTEYSIYIHTATVHVPIFDKPVDATCISKTCAYKMMITIGCACVYKVKVLVHMLKTYGAEFRTACTRCPYLACFTFAPAWLSPK